MKKNIIRLLLGLFCMQQISIINAKADISHMSAAKIARMNHIKMQARQKKVLCRGAQSVAMQSSPMQNLKEEKQIQNFDPYIKALTNLGFNQKDAAEILANKTVDQAKTLIAGSAFLKNQRKHSVEDILKCIKTYEFEGFVKKVNEIIKRHQGEKNKGNFLQNSITAVQTLAAIFTIPSQLSAIKTLAGKAFSPYTADAYDYVNDQAKLAYKGALFTKDGTSEVAKKARDNIWTQNRSMLDGHQKGAFGYINDLFWFSNSALSVASGIFTVANAARYLLGYAQ